MAEPGKPNRANSGSAAGRLQQLSCDQWSILVPKVPFSSLLLARHAWIFGAVMRATMPYIGLVHVVFLGVAVFSANPVQDSLPARRCKAPLSCAFCGGAVQSTTPGSAHVRWDCKSRPCLQRRLKPYDGLPCLPPSLTAALWGTW